MGAKLHTGCPGIVESFDSEARRAKVNLAMRRADETIPPPLVNVPVLFPGNGSWAVLWGLEGGDHVWVLFSERAITGWSEGRNADPANIRFSLSDAVCLPVCAPVGGVEAVPGELLITDGTQRVLLDGTNIFVGTGDDDSTYDQLVTKKWVTDVYGAHTHSVTSGTAAAPTSDGSTTDGAFTAVLKGN